MKISLTDWGKLATEIEKSKFKITRFEIHSGNVDLSSVTVKRDNEVFWSAYISYNSDNISTPWEVSIFNNFEIKDKFAAKDIEGAVALVRWQL